MPSRLDAETKFIDIVKKTVERGGKILIPTLAVGRAQEVMMIIAEKMATGELPRVPVYLDGMLLESTAIHTAYPEYLALNVKRKIYQGDNPFLREEFIRIDDSSKRDEALSQGPSIIMATSGMMTGGPVIEYFKELSSNSDNTLVFVNYQAEGTLGRAILKGAKEVELADNSGMGRRLFKVNMEVQAIEGFSGHSDKSELIRYITAVRPTEKILINHGEPSRSAELAHSLKKIYINHKVKPEILTPTNLATVRLR